MSSETAAVSTDQEIPVGTYVPSKPTDLRSPCPMLNCLASHGYLPRDGRNVLSSHLKRGLDEAGLSWLVCAMVANLVLTDRSDRTPATTLWAKIKATVLLGPLRDIDRFCAHRPGQTDPATGQDSVHLDQLGDAGLLEHNISLSRHDRAQGDNSSRQPALIAGLLACSLSGNDNDGGNGDGDTVSLADISAYRRRRIRDQTEANPAAVYGVFQHKAACGEISLIMNLLGDGERVRRDYLAAFFGEERLPYREGWAGGGAARRRKIGLADLGRVSKLAHASIGFDPSERSSEDSAKKTI